MNKEVLKKTIKEYYESAEEAQQKNRPNTAVILYYKCLVALVDLYLLEQEGNTPSSHTNRFKTTKEKYPDIYFILDKDFPYYQDSYQKIMNKELAEAIKEDVQTMANKTGTRIP